MPVYIHNGIECVSAGILFYRRTKDLEFLFMERKDKKGNLLLEDPGGKSQSDDTTLEMVAAREAAEELNAEIHDPALDVTQLSYLERLELSRDYILDLIKRRSICIPNQRTRYALFLVHLPSKERRNWDFGSHEFHPKFTIERTVRWLSTTRIFSQAVHPRIRHVLKFL